MVRELDGVVVCVVVRTCIGTILMGKPAETFSVNARSLTAPGLRFPPVVSILRSQKEKGGAALFKKSCVPFLLLITVTPATEAWRRRPDLGDGRSPACSPEDAAAKAC